MSWEFNEEISQTYSSHVLKHIPLYEKTIEWSLAWALDNLQANDSILDFGCATGVTLRKFKNAGFTNLWGVDSSPIMYEKFKDDSIKYSSTLPDVAFSLTLANWVLHFNQDKWKILDNLMKLSNTLIVSEKTTKCVTEKYHLWKQLQGVSLSEIEKKSHSLKGKMFLSSPDMYPGKVVHKKLGFYTWLID